MMTRFVFMLIKNDKGYLLIESLLTLVLLSVFLLWLAQAYSFWIKEDRDVYSLLYQVHHMIAYEAQWSTHIEVNNDQIHFHQISGDKVIISLHNNKIRRQVNSRGHEELMRQINHFDIIESSSDFRVRIETNSGESIEKRILKKMEK